MVILIDIISVLIKPLTLINLNNETLRNNILYSRSEILLQDLKVYRIITLAIWSYDIYEQYYKYIPKSTFDMFEKYISKQYFVNKLEYNESDIKDIIRKIESTKYKDVKFFSNIKNNVRKINKYMESYLIGNEDRYDFIIGNLKIQYK